MFLPSSAMFCLLAYTRRGKSLLRGGRLHAPDDIADIVRDEQSACPVHRHAYGAAKSIALGIDKADKYVLGSPNRASIGKRYEYNFVAAARFVIPRAVLADERPAGIRAARPHLCVYD